jgi:hypothetical protein
MRAVLSILFTATVFTPTVASADQCALISTQTADRAVELARKSTRMIEFCEPCTGGVMRGPFTINKVERGARQVEINGKPVDLAYVFIHTKGDEYKNLGLAVGCGATNVSKVVRSTKQAQTPPPPPPPFTPRAPMPRIASADDIGGTWTVSIRGSLSTCGPAPAQRKETWTITIANGSISLMTEQGRELVAPTAALVHNSIRVDLKDRQQPQSGVLQVNQSLKDHFYGRLLHVEKGCAVAFDVMGTRTP